MGALSVGCAPPVVEDVDAGVELPPSGPFAVRVVRTAFGPGAGFGQEKLPDVVLGAPQGGSTSNGALDVLSLGNGGVIELELGEDAVDGAGADLLVFENPFEIAGGGVFGEPAEVAVSEDGVAYSPFPCDPVAAPPNGCAGYGVVFASPDLGVDATNPEEAGGDAFDLADVGLSRARFVRITDRGSGPPSDQGTSGFDLDAIAAASHVDDGE